MRRRNLAQPWAPYSGAYCMPGSLILKMALGEAPEAVPSLADVRSGLAAPAASLGHGVVDRIVNHFASGMRVARLHSAAVFRGHGARHQGFDELEHIFGLSRTFRVEVPAGTPISLLVDSLNQIATVESALPNYACATPFESARPVPAETDWMPWQRVRAQEALAYEPGDPAVLLGLVDSGVAENHDELAGRLLPGFDTVQIGQSDLAQGLELLGDSRVVDSRPVDHYVGHGMGCAGIIGSLGIAMPPGLAGEARILPLRALGGARFPGKPKPVGIGAIADLDMAVKLAVDMGAKVINMSFGTDDSTLDPRMPKPHADVVAYAAARGCILVAASGNNGAETCYWPAAYPEVIAVGASDAEGRPCGFSTRGSHVALCAPGERIFTLGLQGYQCATGTSFAAPFVAAATALLVARAQRRAFPLNGAIARDLLVRTAAPFPTPSINGCGAGILDAYAALKALDALIDQSLPDDPGLVEDD